MRNLMWKDLRQNRNVLVAVAVILGVLYLLPPLVSLSVAPRGPFEQEAWRGLLEFLLVSSWLGVWLTALLMSPAIASSLIAGERADRSSQFAGYLPIPRGKAVASRFVVAILSSLAFLLLNGLICLGCVGLISVLFGQQGMIPHEAGLWVLAAVTMYLMMFGLACLWSSMLSSPVQATIAVVGTAAILATIFFNINNRLLDKETRDTLLLSAAYGVAPILGLVSMGVGAWICRRRLEL